MRPRRQALAAAALVVLFGAARMPLEHRFGQTLRETHLHAEPPGLEMRETLGQRAFVSVLGGFRSLVASILSLQAYTAWENVEWSEVEALYRLITQLQPRVDFYWDTAAWHLAYNAASYHRYQSDAPEALRRTAYDRYVEKGIRTLEDGIRNNPQSHKLRYMLSEVFRARLDPPDHCRAAAQLGAVAGRPGTPEFYRRLHAFQLAQCPGREDEAYALLRALYLEGPRHHKPTLLGLLAVLETELALPAERRVLSPDDTRSILVRLLELNPQSDLAPRYHATLQRLENPPP